MTEAEEMVRMALSKAVREWFAGKTAEHYETKFFESLRDSGLVRLIEAGQAAREWSYSVTNYEDNVPYVNGKYDANVERMQAEYDTAFADMRKRVGRT